MRRYTVARDIIDPNDFRFSEHVQAAAGLPSATRNVVRDGRIRDQGNEGSCTAFTAAGAVAFLSGHDGSPKQLYWSERNLDHDIRQDAGSTGRTMVLALRNTGICAEPLCPYDAKLRIRPPSKRMLADALEHRIDKGVRVTSVDEARAALAAGMPIALGFSVPESFEGAAVAESGLFEMPSPGAKILGGHEVCAIDYDDNSRNGDLIVRNSWGQAWGCQPDGAKSRGYFRMPYDMLFGSHRLVMDAWAIKGLA